MRLRADLVLLLVAAMWGSAFAAQRTAGLLGSVYVFNGARFLVAAALLLPFAWKTRLNGRLVFWMTAAGAVLFAASALQQAGMTTTTAGNAGFLTSLYVVLVPFVLLLGWREKARPMALLAVVLAAGGAYLLATAGRFEPRPGDLLELGGAVLWAFHVVLLGKFAASYEAVTFSTGQMLVAGALNWMASAWTEPIVLPFQPQLVWSILYTAVVSLGLGYTLQVWGQKHTPPTEAALILSLESVFAALAGYIMLGEQLLPVQLLGCVVIVMAVAVAQAGAWCKIPKSQQGAG